MNYNHPCDKCSKLEECILKIKEEANEYGDPTFEEDKCEGTNVDEFMEDAIERTLCDDCEILTNYLNDVSSYNIKPEIINKYASHEYQDKLEDLTYYFGKRVGMWYYNLDGWTVNKDGYYTTIVERKDGYNICLDLVGMYENKLNQKDKK